MAGEPELVVTAPGTVRLLYIHGEPGALELVSRLRLGDLSPALDAGDERAALPLALRAAPNPLRAGRALILEAGVDVAPDPLDLFDLSGRRIARAPFEGFAGRWTARIEGAVTAKLLPGMYFARAGAAGTRRVVVIR